eukprot:gb/GFBE01023865.1/.p1 GENE.gb/GFBE01023865.1/~~gb/GFBE01023865.1/.p1  ORF type:complete len:120 (+),score=13.41 gb/GFBE01023865.1/:1-360(+)
MALLAKTPRPCRARKDSNSMPAVSMEKFEPVFFRQYSWLLLDELGVRVVKSSNPCQAAQEDALKETTTLAHERLYMVCVCKGLPPVELPSQRCCEQEIPGSHDIRRAFQAVSAVGHELA